MMRTVDMESGRIVAEVDMGDDWVAVSPPRLVDGILVIGNAYGELCAISLAGNQVHWRLEGDSSLVYSPPAVVKGALVFSACGPHGSTVTSAVDGKVRWQWKVSATIRGICSTDGELVFVKTLSDSISFVALDAVTGEIRWDREMEPAGIGEAAYSDQSGVAVASGLVVNAFTPGRVEARRTEDGELIWAQSTTGECFCSPVADVRHIVVACVDGSVYVLELGTGEICRILKAKAPLKSTPALTNDGAIVVGQSGGIWIIAKEFQEKEGG
jgi:outer membrane protein assembly factor BamB